MEKIEFINNSAPEISAENLNQLQTNVENAITETRNKGEWITLSEEYGITYRKNNDDTVEIDINKFGLSKDVPQYETIVSVKLPDDCIPDREIRTLLWARNKDSQSFTGQISLVITIEGNLELINSFQSSTSLNAINGRLIFRV